MAITRVTATWTGFSGAPGYTNFFFSAFGGGDVVDLEVARSVAFFQAVRSALPVAVTVSVSPEVAILDEASGDLINYGLAEESPAGITGSGTGVYSAPTGAVVTWNTDTIARGRRLRGRTFLVPMSGGGFQADGTLSSQTITALQNGAEALVGDGSGPTAVIWSRPRGGSGGSMGPITSYRVPDRAAVLRSRRD